MQHNYNSPFRIIFGLVFSVFFFFAIFHAIHLSNQKGGEIDRFINQYYGLGRSWREAGGDPQKAEYILTLEDKLLHVEMIQGETAIESLDFEFQYYKPRRIFRYFRTSQTSIQLDYWQSLEVVTCMLAEKPRRK